MVISPSQKNLKNNPMCDCSHVVLKIYYNHGGFIIGLSSTKVLRLWEMGLGIKRQRF